MTTETYTPPKLTVIRPDETPRAVKRALRWQASIRKEGLSNAQAFVRLCYKLYWFKEMEMYGELDNEASFDSWLLQPENKIGRSTGHLAVQVFDLFVWQLKIPHTYLHGVDKISSVLTNGERVSGYVPHRPQFNGEPLAIGQKKFSIIVPRVRAILDKTDLTNVLERVAARREALDLLWRATHESETDLKDQDDQSAWETLYNGQVSVNMLAGFSNVKDLLSFIGALGNESVVITVKRKKW